MENLIILFIFLIALCGVFGIAAFIADIIINNDKKQLTKQNNENKLLSVVKQNLKDEV